MEASSQSCIVTNVKPILGVRSNYRIGDKNFSQARDATTEILSQNLIR